MTGHISARRAWHDTYFIKTPDKVELLLQNTTLSTVISQLVWERVRDGVSRKNIIVGSHVTMTGKTSASAKPDSVQSNVDLLAKVKRCIQSMPSDDQLFGHFFYGPFTDDVRCQLDDFVTLFLFNQLDALIPDKTNTIKRRYRALCLIRAASADHYRLVFGGDSMFAASNNPSRFESDKSYSPAKICKFVKEKFNVDLDPNKWSRDADAVYATAQEVIETTERRLLCQIASVISKYHDAATKKLPIDSMGGRVHTF